MKVALITVLLVTLTGCAQTRYRMYVHNGTSEKIFATKVVINDEQTLTFGTLDHDVSAGIWPVFGPLGKESTVEWMDFNGENRKVAKVKYSCALRDDSVIFLINSNDTVTVRTGRKLYGVK